MDTNYFPLWKTLETPLVSLDSSHVELFSVLVLFLLTLAAMTIRWHRQIVRHLVQVVSLLVFLYVVYSCLGVFGMIRNVLHGVTLIGSVFTESFFWLSLPVVVMAFTLTSGPYFCGWICPTGAIQEFLAIPREHLGRWLVSSYPAQRGFPKLLKTMLLGLFFAGFMAWVFWLGGTRRFYVEDSSLFWGAALLLLAFLVLTRTADDKSIRGMRTLSFSIILVSALLKSTIVSPMHFAFADVRDPASALSTLVLAVASIFLTRAWCRYICPWGALMGWMHRLSRLRVKATPACSGCGQCEKRCRVEAIEKGQVLIDQCQFCLACVDHCPSKALEVVDVWKRDG